MLMRMQVAHGGSLFARKRAPTGTITTLVGARLRAKIGTVSFAIAIALHLLSAIVWIGGMFFAYVCLRPSLPEVLEPPQAARLLNASLGRFFRWVWVAAITLLLTGFYMAFKRYGFSLWPGWLYTMIGVGIIMMLLFGHLFFVPFRRLKEGLTAGAPETIGKAIGQIRLIVAINLGLGIVVALAASAGRYWI